MEINKQNYEEYFLLYTDNELSAEQRIAVEQFVSENPALRDELDALLQTQLVGDRTPLAFDKTSLYKTEAENQSIDLLNYEAYLLLYIDNELTPKDRSAVDAFVASNEQAQAALLWLQRSILPADDETTFKNKSVLYKREVRIVPLLGQWRRVVAAASIVLIGGLVWMNLETLTKPFVGQVAGTSLTTKDAKNDGSPAANNNDISITQQQLPQEVIQPTPEQPKNNLTASQPKIKQPELAKKSAVQRAIAQKQTTNQDEVIVVKQIAPAQNKATEGLRTAAPDITVKNSAETTTIPSQDLAVTDKKEVKNILPVTPYKISQAAFNGDENPENNKVADIQRNDEGIAFLDTEPNEQKPKNNFRGLVRKTSRLINRNKNNSKEENESLIRIASFAIVKK